LTEEHSFEDQYPIREDVKRFDQRETAFGKALREKGRIVEFASEEATVNKIKQNLPGFQLEDYALHNAAVLYEVLPGEHDPMNTGFYTWKGIGRGKPEGVHRWEGSPDEAAKLIRKAAKFFGAAKVGFTTLDKRWFYTHSRYGKEITFEDVEEGYTTEDKAVFPESHKYVIAIAVPMDYQGMSMAPTELEIATPKGYSMMHIMAGQIAEFIRGLGYHATPTGNDTAISIPIAIQAGLGHLGRHGRLITWEYGPLVRIMKIFTDLPLPQSPQAPGGIIEFCETCKKCAKHCPSRALPMGERTWEGHNSCNNSGVFKWYTDAEKCLDYWNELGSACSICFRVCSFTKKPGILHDVVKWFIRNTTLLNGFFAWTDDLLGYGKIGDPKKFWDS
jgi:epoxyqueuosine reductase